MIGRNRLRFLSTRAQLLVLAQSVLGLALLGLYAAQMPAGAPIWPLLAYLALLLALLLAAYFAIIRPYHRLERMMQLFLDGYTLSGLSESGGVNLSPTIELLIKKVSEEFDSSSLLKLSKRQAQYRALQNQINPHFLYNTLDSIRSEALIAGLESVADMTETLAVFFRYTISKVENLVSLEEELENCETYYRIQQYRFGERLKLRIECAPEDRDEIYRCRLPKLTLQPIMENCIIHGTEFKIGTGHIVVRMERTGDRLLIAVSDDGVGMDEIKLARLNERLDRGGLSFQSDEGSQGGSVALVNVNNRIHLIFGEQYGMHVYSMPGIGTDVQISLPMITSDREAMRVEVP